MSIINTDMKKLSALLWSIPFLAPAVTFAQSDPVNIQLCPPEGDFSGLCGDASSIGPAIGSVVNFIFVVAIIIALIFLIYGGLKWLVSGGDKGKVEEARGTIIAAIIGLIIVFLSYVILNFVLTLFGVDLSNLTLPSIDLTPGTTTTTEG